MGLQVRSKAPGQKVKTNEGRRGCRRGMEMSNLLQASNPYSPQNTTTSYCLLRYPGLASALTGIAEGSRLQAQSGASRDAPFPDRSPLPGKRTRDGGSGPASVRKRVRPPPAPQGLSLAPNRSTATGRLNFPSS